MYSAVGRYLVYCLCEPEDQLNAQLNASLSEEKLKTQLTNKAFLLTFVPILHQEESENNTVKLCALLSLLSCVLINEWMDLSARYCPPAASHTSLSQDECRPSTCSAIKLKRGG